MPCRCAERRTAIGRAARATLIGDVLGLRTAASLVARTTIEDVEAMARRLAGRVTAPHRP